MLENPKNKLATPALFDLEGNYFRFLFNFVANFKRLKKIFHTNIITGLVTVTIIAGV